MIYLFNCDKIAISNVWVSSFAALACFFVRPTIHHQCSSTWCFLKVACGIRFKYWCLCHSHALSLRLGLSCYMLRISEVEIRLIDSRRQCFRNFKFIITLFLLFNICFWVLWGSVSRLFFDFRFCIESLRDLLLNCSFTIGYRWWSDICQCSCSFLQFIVCFVQILESLFRF